jgi:hypothetical protein
MENLFSTIAQISFTLVGLFYLALTLEAKSKDFWFGEKLQSRYVYLNLLFLLLPGFIALSGLIPSAWESISIWPFSGLFLVIIYYFLFREFKKITKELNYGLLLPYEERLDSLGSIKTSLWLLFGASVVGVLAYLSIPSAIAFANFLFGLVLFGITMVSILPINVFITVYSQNKSQKKLSPLPNPKAKPTKVKSNVKNKKV